MKGSFYLKEKNETALIRMRGAQSGTREQVGSGQGGGMIRSCGGRVGGQGQEEQVWPLMTSSFRIKPVADTMPKMKTKIIHKKVQLLSLLLLVITILLRLLLLLLSRGE